MKTRPVIRVLQVILGVFVGLLLAEISVFLYPPLLVLGYALVGRSPECSPLQAFRGAQQSLRHQRVQEKYASPKAGFRLLDSDTSGFHRWSTPDGEYWISEGSDRVLPVLLAQQQADIYEVGTYGVKRGDVVLDCGAHVGVFTRKALNLGAGKVIAIEPGPENLECLRRNLKDEIARGAVVVCPVGVWDQETSLSFQTFPENSAADSFVTQDASVRGRTVTVQVTTVDKLVGDLRLSRVDFVKMDIKGSTERALLGAKQTLVSYLPRLVISTEETADDPMRIIRFAEQLQPLYKTECGYCAIDKGLVIPMVVCFHK